MRKKKSKHQYDTSDIPRHVVITFVKSLEKAEQYFELKDHLRGRDDVQHHLCVPEESINEVVEEVKADGRFKMLDEEDILRAADMLHRELLYAYLSEIAPTYIRKQKTNSTAEISAEEMEERIREEFPFLRIKYDDLPGMDFRICRDPMYYLVNQKRAKGFVLNPNLKLEIKQLQEKHSIYYCAFFLAVGSKYKIKIVTFRCVGCDDVAKFLKLLLSDCGEIASVEISSLDKQSQMAHVTFGDVDDADEALCFAANGFPGKEHLIGDHMVDIIPAPYHELPWVAPGHIKQEEVKAAKCFAQNVENELYDHAVSWYRGFYEEAKASNAPEKAEGSKRTKKSNVRRARRRAEAGKAFGSSSCNDDPEA